MVSTSFMVDTSSHPSAQLHRCVENSAYSYPRRSPHAIIILCGKLRGVRSPLPSAPGNGQRL